MKNSGQLSASIIDNQAQNLLRLNQRAAEEYGQVDELILSYQMPQDAISNALPVIHHSVFSKNR